LALGVFVCVTALYAIWYLPLKKVTATSHGLRISNYLTTVSVPYEKIVRVHELKWLNIRPITVANNRCFRAPEQVRPQGSLHAA